MDKAGTFTDLFNNKDNRDKINHTQSYALSKNLILANN